MPKVGVFLQARLASSRFPNKVIAKFAQWTVIEQAMGTLSGMAGTKLVVTDEESVERLKPLAEGFGWGLYAGHPTDVMKRFIDCAAAHDIDVIVRATGDNPLVDLGLANFLLATHLRCNGEATRAWGATPGTAIEVVNTDALRRNYGESSAYDREHVMPVVYAREPFNTLIVKPRYRESVTIDTEADLKRVEAIHEQRTTGNRELRED